MKRCLLWIRLCVMACILGFSSGAKAQSYQADENERLSSYLVWVGVKFSNAKEEELLINDASQIGSKKFDFSIE